MDWNETLVDQTVQSLQDQTSTDLPEDILTNNPNSMLKSPILNNPCVIYLFGNEIIHNISETPLSSDERIKEGLDARYVHMFTDRRFLSLTRATNGEHLLSIPYSNITNFEINSGGLIIPSSIDFWTQDKKYSISLNVNKKLKNLFHQMRDRTSRWCA